LVISEPTDGPFTKACVEICHGMDDFTASATIAAQANQEVIANEGRYYPDQRIDFIGKQPAPFAFLAVTSPNNQVVVLHGIRCLEVPFCFKHDHDGHILAFYNDAEQQGGIPQIVQLQEKAFGDPKEWTCPDLAAALHAKDNIQVLPVFDTDERICTTKVVPLPNFLVPLFINRGNPFNAIAALQVFTDEFVANTTKELTDHLQYIYNFLRAATGFNEAQEDAENPESQLTIEITAIELDDLLMQWAINHFGGILQMAQLHDTRMMETDNNNNNEGRGLATLHNTPQTIVTQQSQTQNNTKSKKKQIMSPRQLYRTDERSKQAQLTQQTGQAIQGTTSTNPGQPLNIPPPAIPGLPPNNQGQPLNNQIQAPPAGQIPPRQQ